MITPHHIVSNHNNRPVKSLSEPPRGASWMVLTGGVLILSTEDKA